MRTLRSLALVATLAGGIAASAASAAPIIIDTASNAPLAGMTYTSFNSSTLGSAAQTTSTGIGVKFAGAGAFVQGASIGAYAPPTVTAANGAAFGSATTGADATTYVSTGTGNAMLSFASPTSYFGLLWGSIDAGNYLTFTGLDGVVTTLTAAQVFGSAFDYSGAQSRYVNFTSASPFTSVVLSSATPSFEFDNVATMAQTTAVPEPAAWTMMIAGMGMIGFAARRRRPRSTRVAYAA